MKKITCIIIISFLSISNFFAQEKMPIQKLEISIDGKNFVVNENDTLKYDNKSIIVKLSKNLDFNFGGLSFNYPNHFAFQNDTDLGVNIYSLDGNNFIITYFDFEVEVKSENIISEMIKKFGKKNCKTSSKKIILNNIELVGTRIDIDLLEIKLTYDIFKIENKDHKTNLISFQDTKNQDGSDSKESIETLGVINNSLKILN
jgi:hypothetical protein